MAIICFWSGNHAARRFLTAIGEPGPIGWAAGSRVCFRRSRYQGALALTPECRAASLVDFLVAPAGAGHRPARLSWPPAASCSRQGRADRRGHALRRIALRAAVAAVFSRGLEYRACRSFIPPRRRRGAGNAWPGRARLPPSRHRARPLRRVHRARARLSR